MSDSTTVWISASQLDSFLDCPRQWWFRRVLRLPEPSKTYFTFGTVLHASLERWFAATENGRVPDPGKGLDLLWDEGPLKGQRAGDPVEVFPAGWETVEERGKKASVTPTEARLIRRLVAEAVERGIVQRRPGQQVERKLELPVIEGVNLVGYVDVFRPAASGVNLLPEIHDHKTFGEGSVRYLKQPGPKGAAITAPYSPDDGTSPNCVAHNQQMLTYAAATSILDDHDGDVVVRHNQFPKFEDAKGVRTVEAVVAPERWAAHWVEVQQAAEKMLRVRKIKKWDDTPGPTSTDSCSRYGGCPFRGICGRRETPEVYSERVDRQERVQGNQKPLDLSLTPRSRSRRKKQRSGGEPMGTSIFDRVKGANAPAAQPEPAAEAPAINGGQAPVAAPTAGAGAPWSKPDCPACKGAGVAKNGRPCMICDSTAKREGRPTSAMYATELTDAGLVAVALPDHLEALEAMGALVEWQQGQAAEASPAKPKAAPARSTTTTTTVGAPTFDVKVHSAVKLPDPEPDDDDDSDDEPTPAAKPAARAPKLPAAGNPPGRPKKGITLLIGASPLVGPTRPTTTIQALLETVGAELAADMGAASYWELDTWKRRDRIRQRAEEIAQGLGRTIVLCPTMSDPDLANLVSALLPCAEWVVEGLR